MRVVLADDSVLLREGLARLLAELGHDVVATVGDADALLRAVEEASPPDLVISDIRMPPRFADDGLRACLELRRRLPGLPCLVLSQHAERAYAQELLAHGSGSIGYLLKDRVADVDTFALAMETVFAGGTVLDAELAARLVAQRQDPLSALTPREREVLELIAQGRSNAGICDALVLSTGAVEKHVASIFTKLGLAPDHDDHRRVLAVLAYLGVSPQ
jgi:DNA-binding NarL/FixJ family response regulator